MFKGMAVASLAILAAGCGTSGDFRRISFSSDLSSADLAHYESRSAGSGKAPVKLEDYSTGLPFWPVVWRSRDGHSDADSKGARHYHFEDDWGLALWTVTTHATANFDPQGRNVAWEKGQKLLLGAVSNSNGEQMVDGRRVSTSDFRLLWGFFETERTAQGRSWRLFWIPFIGD